MGNKKNSLFQKPISSKKNKIRNLTGQLSDLCSLKTDSISTTLTKFSNAWKDFGEQGFDWREEVPPNAKDASSKIESIIKSIAETWNTIGANYKEQSDFELGNSLRHFNEYSQIITNFQPALKTRDDARLNYHVTQNALIKAERNALQNEKEKLKIEQARKQTERAKEGADTTSIILLAESEHFRTSRLEDSKIMLAEYLDSQIDFYQKSLICSKIRPEIDNVSIQKGNNK
ncbi:sorting nexin [Anaeramoeba ignava]|uniref:Sorting nexin n=1 Tax=Anaeramoeba ignava TaxID=1746090 RepID=A0A9Q0LVM9_ANAIG|nr:sorting nexin [Anaeramoeba ignava]